MAVGVMDAPVVVIIIIIIIIIMLARIRVTPSQ